MRTQKKVRQFKIIRTVLILPLAGFLLLPILPKQCLEELKWVGSRELLKNILLFSHGQSHKSWNSDLRIRLGDTGSLLSCVDKHTVSLFFPIRTQRDLSHVTKCINIFWRNMFLVDNINETRKKVYLCQYSPIFKQSKFYGHFGCNFMETLVNHILHLKPLSTRRQKACVVFMSGCPPRVIVQGLKHKLVFFIISSFLIWSLMQVGVS